MKLKSRLKKREKKSKKVQPVKPRVEKKRVKEKVKVERVLVKKGFARKGDLIATLKPGVNGKDGKNIFGETISAKEVKGPRLIAGKYVKVENGVSYYMNVDGIVEVLKDEKENYFIKGRLYKHGRFNIEVSDDEMEAFLTVIPSFGGAKTVNPDEVFETCKKEGIAFGLNEDKIRETIQKAETERVSVDNVLIAEGEEPVNGDDGKFEFKVKLASGSKIEIMEDGRTDYKAYDLITRVKEGDLVAVVTKPKSGVKDGHTVKGETIGAEKGHDVEVIIGNNVKVEDKGDTISYYSRINGQLLTEGKNLSIEPLMIIEGDVGPKTGNISFDGVVFIKGNVNDGYRVYAKKDLNVQGNVSSAFLNSDGNINIKNGVIGRYKGLVSAKGDITLKFAENSNIQAVGNIYIQRAALNCKLTSGNKIVSKQEKGQLIGGEIRAKKGIEVKFLGNDSESKMDVYVGLDFFLERQLQELKEKLHKYEESLKKIILLLEKLEKVAEVEGGLTDKLEKVHSEACKKKTLVKIAIDNLRKKEREHLMKLSEVEESKIVVYETLYRGVKIHFGMATYEPNNAIMGVKIYYNNKFRKIDVVSI